VLLDRFSAVVDASRLVAFRYLVLFGEFGAGVTRDEFFPALFGGGAVLGGTLFGSGITFCARAALIGYARANSGVAMGHRRDVYFMFNLSSAVRSV
jgi:hypothetical protein